MFLFVEKLGCYCNYGNYYNDGKKKAAKKRKRGTKGLTPDRMVRGGLSEWTIISKDPKEEKDSA